MFPQGCYSNSSISTIKPVDIQNCEREAWTTGAENFGWKFGVKMGFKKDPKDNTGISPDYVRKTYSSYKSFVWMYNNIYVRVIL